MLEYLSNKYSTKIRRVDIMAVRIGKRRAYDLEQHVLFAELQKIHPEAVKKFSLNRDMAKPDLIFCLGVHQQELQEAEDAA
jgi:hypothetical protein